MKRTVSFGLILGLAAILALGIAPVWAAECGPGSAPPKPVCECGDTVVGDYDFPSDLTCGDDLGEPVDGLTVNAGVNVDLKGFQLRGTTQQGIGFRLLPGVGGSIQNGVIRGFNVGIRSDGLVSVWTLGTPNGVTVTANKAGLELSADDSTIVNTAVTSNVNDGVFLGGAGNTIMRSSCSKNGGTGLFVVGDDNRFDTNRCERNGGWGIVVVGEDNVLVRNLASSNGLSGVIGLGDGNTYQRNQGHRNGEGGVLGFGANLHTDGRNYATGNGILNCFIEGFPSTVGGRYC